MKLAKVVFLLLLLLSLGAWYSVTSPLFIDTELEMQVPVKRERLQQDVAFFTSITPARNANNPASLNKAATYIYEIFSSSGLETSYQTYQVNNQSYSNVLASIGPASAPKIIIGAHYDVCGDQAGADDNASGVAGLLEVARLIGELKPALDFSVELVAYSLEEPPYFRTEHMGSAVHARSIKDNNHLVEVMICLEMIGFYSEEPKSQSYPIGLMKLFYPDKANFVAVVGKSGTSKPIKKTKKLMRQSCDIEVRSIAAPPNLVGIDFSDHLNYWAYDYPAVMINNTAFYRSPHYHQQTDTMETLDFDKMAEVVKGIYGTITNW
ncbi:MAG: M28 family peptidase [Cyclobacteriaceae bacterium]